MNQSYSRRLIIVLTCVIALLTACAGSGPPNVQPSKVSVTVLFFNDLHGYLKPFEVKTDTGNQEVGGIARLSTLIDTVRKENDRKNIKTLVLVAGDILQGTPMSTVFKGEPDIKCLNVMGVDALTVGNHEFDFGLENFLKIKDEAVFPFLSANIIEKDSGRKLCRSSLSIQLTSDLSFTIIGVTTRQLLHTTKADNVATLDVIDPLASIKPAYDQAKKIGPVVLLSHSRHQTDRAIAQALPELVAIIGGHDQILLSPYRKVGPVPIFQAFEKGRYLGRIDLEIDTTTKKAKLVSGTYMPVTATVQPHLQVAKIVSTYDQQLGEQFKEVIGVSKSFLDGERDHVRYEETALGNFITDIMVAHTGAQVAMINSGALRASIKLGPITVTDVFKAMPYANELMLVKLTGAELAQVLKRAVQGQRSDEDGGFLHVSQLFFEIKGRHPVNIRVGKDKALLEPERVYTVAVPDFLASGGDGHSVFNDKPLIKTGLPLRELIVDTIKQRRIISAEVEGRIKRLP